MSFISNLTQKVQNLVSDTPKTPAAPAPAPATPAPTNVTTASLSNTSEAPRSFAASDVTNSQGHAARLALGSNDIGAVGGEGNTAANPGGANRIDASYDSSLKTNGKDPLNPESKESRMADLKGLSQRDNNSRTIDDGNRCGASAVVAGAYYSKGTDGLKDLAKDMEAYSKANKLKMSPYDGDPGLKKRLESGKLTKDDMNRLQDNLHAMMQKRQDDIYKKAGQDPDMNPGIGSGVVKDFMQNASNTKRNFDDSKLVIGQVDTDRDGTGNHFILSGMHNDKPFVYDSESIRGSDGKLDQVTQDPDRLRLYRDSLTAQANNQKYVYSQESVPFRQD